MKSTCPIRPLVPMILSIISTVLLSTNAFAWGPHGEITQAALDAMGPNDALVRHLGPDARRLTQYVWMADFRQTLLVRSDEVFYADDYLLFPAATRHYQHICPEVKQTYSPYFRRALQAMRTESTHNASRWIGSLLHFTTDTGSPPHAAEILGPVHSKMENWLDAKLIHIPGYQPQLLGEDDAAAEAGFLRRMDGLIEFSKERAQRCRADLDADRRALVEPVVLESALETARVTADLLHTLGVLAAKATGDATLTGKVIAPKLEHPTMSRLTSKVVLLGTSYSTLTEQDGTFTFRHLPAVEYRVVVIAPGRVSEAKPVSLAAAASVSLEAVDLSKGADGNLLRNASFSSRWVSAEAFDHWSMRNPPGKLAAMSRVRDWDGEWIPLQDGVTYQLTAKWKSQATDANGPQVFLRTKPKADGGSATTDSAPVVPGAKEVAVTGSPEAAWAQVCLRTSQSPDAVVEAISLRQAAPTKATTSSPDPVMRLKLLPPGPDNPRNSEVAFLRLKDGRILMVYSHFTGKQGADESPCHLAGRYSSDGGKSWTKDDMPVVSGDEAKTGNVMSPSLLRLQDGRIALFYLRLNGPLDDRPIMRVSTDEAQTWSEPQVCISDDEVGLYILNNDRAVQLKSGRLVLPLARHDDVAKPSKFNDYPRTLCYLSDDSGQTWRRSKTLLYGIPTSGNRVALQEPGVVELKDGRLMMFCRTHTGYIYRSFSGDGGDTWSPAVRYPGLFAPISAAAIERIPKTGDLMMVWNDHTGIATSATSPYKGKRTPYNVAISRDEGETWENVKTLEDDPNGWYCYTAVEFVGNDVLLAHCAGWQPRPEDAPGHETKLALTQLTRFPLSFLYDGPPISVAPDFAKGKRIQVFVLTGQSNSLGTTEDPDEKDITPGIDPLDAQIPFFWSNRSTRAGDGPAMLYGNSGGKIVTLRAQQGEGPDPMFWGPEIGFGRSLAAAGMKDFMIVKASRGGGGNSYWLKGNGDDHMYRHVVETVREAVQQLPTGTEFDIAGLLYLQGESDHAAEAAVASERLLTLAANLRKDLPNATAMKVLVSGIVPSGKNQDIVRAQQSALPALDPKVRYLDNMAWKPRRYDGAHYVKSAKLEIGQRLGKMWLEW